MGKYYIVHFSGPSAHYIFADVVAKFRVEVYQTEWMLLRTDKDAETIRAFFQTLNDNGWCVVTELTADQAGKFK